MGRQPLFHVTEGAPLRKGALGRILGVPTPGPCRNLPI
jgi:hypothetical protein